MPLNDLDRSDPREMLAITMARLLDDGNRVVAGGPNSELFMAAALFAQKRHAPNLRLLAGGAFHVNVRDVHIEALPLSATDSSVGAWAEGHHEHSFTFLHLRPPGGPAYADEDSPFRDAATYGHMFFGDKFLIGGIEVDAYGAVNLFGVGEEGLFDFRGPGPVGLSDAALGQREIYVFMPEHSPLRLVERTSYTTMPTNADLREAGYQGRIRKIITPAAIFDFETADGRARLRALLPGADLEWVRQNTGFEFECADPVSLVPAPTSEELVFLRREIDPTGVLRGLDPRGVKVRPEIVVSGEKETA